MSVYFPRGKPLRFAPILNIYFKLYFVHVCLCIARDAYRSPQIRKRHQGIRPPKSALTGACELPSGCWKPTPGALQELEALSPAGPSLQPHRSYPEGPAVDRLGHLLWNYAENAPCESKQHVQKKTPSCEFLSQASPTTQPRDPGWRVGGLCSSFRLNFERGHQVRSWRKSGRL